jgi:hypothetical protein
MFTFLSIIQPTVFPGLCICLSLFATNISSSTGAVEKSLSPSETLNGTRFTAFSYSCSRIIFVKKLVKAGSPKPEVRSPKSEVEKTSVIRLAKDINKSAVRSQKQKKTSVFRLPTTDFRLLKHSIIYLTLRIRKRTYKKI